MITYSACGLRDAVPLDSRSTGQMMSRTLHSAQVGDAPDGARGGRPLARRDCAGRISQAAGCDEKRPGNQKSRASDSEEPALHAGGVGFRHVESQPEDQLACDQDRNRRCRPETLIADNAGEYEERAEQSRQDAPDPDSTKRLTAEFITSAIRAVDVPTDM